MKSSTFKRSTRAGATSAAPARCIGALALGAAIALTGLSGAALAADNGAATARALAHIQAFPGRTLHSADQAYVARNVVIDADGAEHVRFERSYKGLRVIGGDLIVHSNRSGAFVDATRTLRDVLSLDTAPTLASGDAVAAARQRYGADAQISAPKLVVYARGARPELAYDVRVFIERADQTPSELHVIVSAHRAEVLEAWDDIQTAPAAGSGKGFFNGTVALTTDLVGTTYSLRDPSRGNQYTVDMRNIGVGKGKLFTDADNLWGDGTLADRQTVGVDAQYGTSVTWDYYKNVHGRLGIANDGKGAYNRVHYKKNYANAFWSDDCFCMTYGDGDGRTIYPLDSLDVAGHEMTHGVTSRTAGLIYSGESGGLNEGTSDIMGTNVEFYAANPNDPGDYLIGEEVFKSGYLRSMIKPSADGASADCYYRNVGNLDVHYSSGVANHVYYLMAEGTVAGAPSPTCLAGDTKTATGTGTVAALTRAKAEKIWYRALTVYMTSSTNYAAARAATLSAAADLYGAGSPEVGKVAAAWTAVNVN